MGYGDYCWGFYRGYYRDPFPIPYSLGSHAARTANPALSPQAEDIAIITVRSKISYGAGC